MDEMYKAYSINFYNRLKNTVNGSVNCKIDEENDKMNITIARMGLQYKTYIPDISKIVGDIKETEKEFDKVVRKYRSFVEHKFFYN